MAEETFPFTLKIWFAWRCREWNDYQPADSSKSEAQHCFSREWLYKIYVEVSYLCIYKVFM